MKEIKKQMEFVDVSIPIIENGNVETQNLMLMRVCKEYFDRNRDVVRDEFFYNEKSRQSCLRSVLGIFIKPKYETLEQRHQRTLIKEAKINMATLKILDIKIDDLSKINDAILIKVRMSSEAYLRLIKLDINKYEGTREEALSEIERLEATVDMIDDYFRNKLARENKIKNGILITL